MHAITVHPTDHDTIYVGSTKGIYPQHQSRRQVREAERAGATPTSGRSWCTRRTRSGIYAGATPIDVYRSDDGGDNWKKLADPGLPDRVIMAFACRVMRLDVDPNSPDDVYATLEANGAMRSRNAGESWEDCTADLIRFCEEPKYRSRIGSQTEIEGMLDGHALACSAAAPGTVFLANRMGLFRSADRGEHLGGHGDRPLLAADLWPRHPHLAARPEGAVRGAQPGGALDRRLGLPQRRCRQDLEALRPRHQGRRDDDGRDDPPARPEPGLCASRASARCSARRTAARAGAKAGCPKACATATRSPPAEKKRRSGRIPSAKAGRNPPTPYNVALYQHRPRTGGRHRKH